MTNTQLKAQIDNNISNETAPLGITPSEVGTNIKAVVDYVDQEAALLVLKVTGKSLILDTEITRLGTMTAIFTTALKNAYDAAVSALTSKEDNINKSTNVTTDGASNTKYPSVKSIKDYVDNSLFSNELWSNKSTDVTADGASDVKYPSVKAVKTYVDANSGALPYKQSSFKTQQNGTSDPSIYNMFIDEVQISPTDNANPLFRLFSFTRTGSGQSYFRITWFTGSASAVNINKVDLSVADGNIKFTSLGTGSLAPYSWVQFNINAYDSAGALADNELYTNFYVKLYN